MTLTTDNAPDNDARSGPTSCSTSRPSTEPNSNARSAVKRPTPIASTATKPSFGKCSAWECDTYHKYRVRQPSRSAPETGPNQTLEAFATDGGQPSTDGSEPADNSAGESDE